MNDSDARTVSDSETDKKLAEAVNNFLAHTVSVSEGGGNPTVAGNNVAGFAVLEAANTGVSGRPLQSNRLLRCL